MQQESQKAKPEHRQDEQEIDRQTDGRTDGRTNRQTAGTGRPLYITGRRRKRIIEHKHEKSNPFSPPLWERPQTDANANERHAHTHLEVPVHYVMLVGVRHTV